MDAETAGSHTIEVTATSTDGSTSTQSFTIDVNDVNETAISAVSDTDASGNTVAENAAIGTAVGITALATDADVTDTVTYSLSSNPGGFFAIDANTGIVTVAGALDAETATSHTIEVTATSTDGSTSSQSFTIDVTDVNEFAVGSISDADATSNTVSESAANGTAVGVTALATDADVTDTVTYSLTDDAGGRFAIDANTGEITVANGALLDYETATSHTVEVTATSTDGSTSSETFTINLTDDTSESSVGPVSDSNAAANAVDEDASVGAVVGITALATDPDVTDTVTYSLTDNAGGLFAIDANTGIVTVAGSLDAETAGSHTIEVTATSTDGSTSTQTFTIDVNDVNETAISAVSDTDASGNTVAENAAIGTAVGITALATDADVTDTVTYSLSSNPGGFFAIDANTGIVTVAGSLDAETATSHTIEVTATSTDGSTSSQSFTIDVTDVNEFAVGGISDADATSNTVSESAANGTAVGVTALATDADVTDTVTYSLSDDAGGRFAIDANTGEITVADTVRCWIMRRRLLTHRRPCTATSTDGSTSSETFTINLTDDTSESSPSDAVTDSNAAANAVDEDASVGAVVGITALATDPDVTDTVTYSLTDNAGGLFAIDANTGIVTVAGSLDAETAGSHTIEVTATSTDGSTSTQTFTIDVNDVNETAISAVSDTDASGNTVAENAAIGTAVGITALATDADVTDTVTYSLSSNPGGFFAIDANTGIVTVAGALDAETATSHTIEVTATSTDGSTSTQSFTISVSDVDEYNVGAVTDADATSNTVSESAANGTAVGVTALATDADVTDTVTYSLTDDAGGRFAIDANTGEITVANGALLDYETATSHTVEVTATSTDGSTSSETFTINLTDDTSEISPSALSRTATPRRTPWMKTQVSVPSSALPRSPPIRM